jgi:hypothetical protein
MTSGPFAKLAQSVSNLPPGYAEPSIPKEPPPLPKPTLPAAPPPPPAAAGDTEIVQLNVPVTLAIRKQAKVRAAIHGLTIKAAIPLLVEAWVKGMIEIPPELIK